MSWEFISNMNKWVETPPMEEVAKAIPSSEKTRKCLVSVCEPSQPFFCHYSHGNESAGAEVLGIFRKKGRFVPVSQEVGAWVVEDLVLLEDYKEDTYKYTLAYWPLRVKDRGV